LPATRTEYKTQQFSFPALLDDITIDVADVGFGRYPISLTSDAYGTGINTFISVTPDLRPTLSLPTRIRIVTTFYTYQPAPDNIFNIVTQDVSYNGIMFNFNFGDVLTNGQTITVTADANDQRYSGLTESVTFQASSPSRSSYTAQIGSEKVIFSDVEYYKSNIWFKRTGYVTLV
jgi:hypothetical protein